MDDSQEQLRRLIDLLYRDNKTVARLDVLLRAESLDLPADVLTLISLLPPSRYTRGRLCDQLNSAITAHGWARRLGTLE